MRDGKKKVWICLLVVVLAAVTAGLLYWLSTPRAPSTEGFLIRDSGNTLPVSAEFCGAGSAVSCRGSAA